MKHSHSTLFLMELIISILFFSLASAVYIQLFAKAHILGNKTTNENHALTETQNLAESFLATEGNLSEMKTLFSNAELIDKSLKLYYDKNWSSTTSYDACYVAILDTSRKEKDFCVADISVKSYNKDEDNVIYSLTVMHHIKERRANIE